MHLNDRIVKVINKLFFRIIFALINFFYLLEWNALN